MIFGFGKKNQQQDDFDEEVELVLFQGTFSGVVVDLSEHARLVEAGRCPMRGLGSGRRRGILRGRHPASGDR